jgi:uncharacterized membrane protein YbhN (UPF0104 family)
MKPLWRRILGPGLSIILFTAAVWLLHGELKTYHIRDILHAYDAIPGAHLWTAAGLTILSYAVMTGYDGLAMRYIRQPLSYSKIGMASFIGCAFSNNIGLSMIAGASVRYRLYSAWGLSALQITQVVAFCTLTLWLGFFTLGGAVFLIEPPTIPAAIHLPPASLRAIGMVMLAVVLSYLIVTTIKKTAIKIRHWEFQLPSAGLFVSQLIIAALDWMLASLVLFVLLAPGHRDVISGVFGRLSAGPTGWTCQSGPGGTWCVRNDDRADAVGKSAGLPLVQPGHGAVFRP